MRPLSIEQLRARLDAGKATPQDFMQISWLRTARKPAIYKTPAERLTRDIASYIRAYRENNKLTLREFAARAQVHKSYVSQVECGLTKQISLRNAIKLLQGCGVTLEFTFKRKPS